MKKSEQLRLLALLLAVCSIVAILGGCSGETTTTGDSGGQQSTSTAPEPSSTAAPETTQPEDVQKYYLSGTWLMNETLEPLAELTGKTQKEEISSGDLLFYAGGTERRSNLSWSFSYLDYEDGYTTKTVKWKKDGAYVTVYTEGKAFSDYTGWESEECRTIVFLKEGVNEVSKEFFQWFTKNAVKISDEGHDWQW